MLNYCCIVWTCYFTCQGLNTAKFPDVKVPRRHILLSKSFTIDNKKNLAWYPNGILFVEVVRGPSVSLTISSIIALGMKGHKSSLKIKCCPNFSGLQVIKKWYSILGFLSCIIITYVIFNPLSQSLEFRKLSSLLCFRDWSTINQINK